MGGGGFMMAANQSLKNNRDKRRKKGKSFNGLASDVNEKTEYDLPKSSHYQLEKMKRRLILERKIRRTKIFIFVAVCFSILLFVFLYYV